MGRKLQTQEAGPRGVLLSVYGEIDVADQNGFTMTRMTIAIINNVGTSLIAR